MAVQRYVLTTDLTLPAGSFTLDASSGERVGTGSYAQGAGNWGSGAGSAGGSTNWYAGQVIWADPAGELYTAIGAGNLRAFRDGTDDVGHAAISN